MEKRIAHWILGPCRGLKTGVHPRPLFPHGTGGGRGGGERGGERGRTGICDDGQGISAPIAARHRAVDLHVPEEGRVARAAESCNPRERKRSFDRSNSIGAQAIALLLWARRERQTTLFMARAVVAALVHTHHVCIPGAGEPLCPYCPPDPVFVYSNSSVSLCVHFGDSASQKLEVGLTESRPYAALGPAVGAAAAAGSGERGCERGCERGGRGVEA